MSLTTSYAGWIGVNECTEPKIERKRSSERGRERLHYYFFCPVWVP